MVEVGQQSDHVEVDLIAALVLRAVFKHLPDDIDANHVLGFYTHVEIDFAFCNEAILLKQVGVFAEDDEVVLLVDEEEHGADKLEALLLKSLEGGGVADALLVKLDQ